MIAVMVSGIASAVSWATVSIAAMLDWTQVTVALIAAFASIAQVVFIALFRRSHNELREGQQQILGDQHDVKRKLGTARREGDRPPPPPLT